MCACVCESERSTYIYREREKVENGVETVLLRHLVIAATAGAAALRASAS